VTTWRNQTRHRHSHSHSQIQGRAGVFDDDRLRVASVLRDYGLNDRVGAPEDSKRIHDARPVAAGS